MWTFIHSLFRQKTESKPALALGVLACLFSFQTVSAQVRPDLHDKRALLLASYDNPKELESWLFDIMMQSDPEKKPLEWVRAVWVYATLASDSAVDQHDVTQTDIHPAIKKAQSLAAKLGLYEEMLDLHFSDALLKGTDYDASLFEYILEQARIHQIPSVRVRYKTIYALYLNSIAQEAQGLGQVEEAIKEMERLHDLKDYENLSLKNYMALSFHNMNQTEKAFSLLTEVDAMASKLNLRSIRMPILHNIGKTWLRADESVESALRAKPYFEHHLKLAREIMVPWNEALALVNLAIVEKRLNQLDAAIPKLKQAIELFHKTNDSKSSVEAYTELASAEISRQNWNAALQANEEAFARARKDTTRPLLTLQKNFYLIQKARGHYQTALQHLEEYTNQYETLVQKREKEAVSDKIVTMGLALEEERNRIQKLELEHHVRSNRYKTMAVALLTCCVLLAMLAFFRIRRKNHKIEALNNFIRIHVLQRFLPPELVAEIAEGRSRLNDEAKKCEVTVLFADLCSFTRATEHLGAEKVSRILNCFLASMTDIIFRHGGTIDKFMGDGIMVIFGAPTSIPAAQQAQKAVQCAITMRDELIQLNRIWQAEFNWQFQMRLGIHQGTSIVGSFGSERRADYTVVGSAVNIASRLEGQAQPNQILVTAAVAKHLDKNARRPDGTRKLRGVDYEVEVYSIIAEQTSQEMDPAI